MLSDVHHRPHGHSQRVNGVVDRVGSLWDHETAELLVGDGTTFRESAELTKACIQTLQKGNALAFPTVFMQFKNTLDLYIGGEKNNQLFHGFDWPPRRRALMASHVVTREGSRSYSSSLRSSSAMCSSLIGSEA